MKKRFKWFVGVVIFVFMFSFSGVTEAISTKTIKDEITCPVCDKTIKAEGSKKDRQKALDIVKDRDDLDMDKTEVFVTVLNNKDHKIALVHYEDEQNHSFAQRYINLNTEQIVLSVEGIGKWDKEKKEGNFKLRVGDKEIINEDFNQDGLKGKGNKALLNSVKKASPAKSKLESCNDLVTKMLGLGSSIACAGACMAVGGAVGAVVCSPLCLAIENGVSEAGAKEICEQFFG
ncbi:ABC transporter substrate-binding protein [Bacillus amyloliquefaciens]|uniref:ABC transporter substrate-binding protein n=1 Tax=Bacillus amyloliquefaciens TaxID=1390 RepID=UPI003A89C817